MIPEGESNATRNFQKPFIAINPDTLWNSDYLNELKDLEDFISREKNCLLLVRKNLSFDTSFKGDFNLDNSIVSRSI